MSDEVDRGERLLHFEKVSKIYRMGENEIHALRDVTLTVPRGEFLSVMGPSGSGKSTLLNMMGCIDVPSSGQVFLNGREVSKLKDRELTKIRLREIGFIFQQFYLIPTLTARENVELPLKEAGLGRTERLSRARELLETVGLGQREGHFPRQLSGGEQQRVAIARALANRPQLLLADEPTGEIDSETAGPILHLLEELNRELGLTLVIVTHDPQVASRAARIVRMKDGRVIL